MFDFIRGKKKNKELEAIIARIDSNVANNYKDAAQEALKELERRVAELTAEGTLDERQKEEYLSKLGEYKEKMKEFTHKAQKPYWT